MEWQQTEKETGSRINWKEVVKRMGRKFSE